MQPHLHCYLLYKVYQVSLKVIPSMCVVQSTHYTVSCIHKPTYSNAYTQNTTIVKTLRSHCFSEHILNETKNSFCVRHMLQRMTHLVQYIASQVGKRYGLARATATHLNTHNIALRREQFTCCSCCAQR